MIPTLSLLLLPPALANGQTTHVWIGRAALDHLPEGELRDVLTGAELEPMLVHGCMFPDGGYPLDHAYAEAAHWESFQHRYLDWIVENYGPPWTDEGLQHAAFLLGLGCHGMADQVFDAHYQNRSQGFDGDLGWAEGRSMDEATDVAWAAITGAQVVPERWVPSSTLIALYTEHGIEVDEETLDEGQTLLEVAIDLVGWLGTNEEVLAGYEASFPWATTHLEDIEVPGRPEEEAVVVARYWEELWARLNGEDGPREVLRTWPEDGGWKEALDPAEHDARVSIVFAKPRLNAEVTLDFFEVVDATGQVYELEDPWLFYGDSAHIVHLVPTGAWADDQTFTVTVRAGLPDMYGGALQAGHVFTFSTADPPSAETGGRDREPNRIA